MGHICVVGFVRRRLDVHKSEKLSHSLPYVTLDGGMHVRIFFACCIEMFV